VKLPSSHATPHTIRYIRGGAAAVWGAQVRDDIIIVFLHTKISTNHASLFLSLPHSYGQWTILIDYAGRSSAEKGDDRERERELSKLELFVDR
jgi:hypothetical protein